MKLPSLLHGTAKQYYYHCYYRHAYSCSLHADTHTRTCTSAYLQPLLHLPSLPARAEQAAKLLHHAIHWLTIVHAKKHPQHFLVT